MKDLSPSNPPWPRWVDFHCHLDLYPDHTALVDECDREQVMTLTVTTTPKAWARNLKLAARSRHVRVALGLHPQLVAERASELSLFEQLLPEARYVGEVGLDAGPRFYSSLATQQRIFERVLHGCAEQGGKVLTVHAFRAVPRVLDNIERHLPSERGRVVLHWFTGTASDAQRALQLGCYFSINEQMLQSAKQRALVVTLPINRLLTETDGPFVVRDRRPIRPRDVAHTVTELAALRGIASQAMREALLENLAALVRSDAGN